MFHISWSITELSALLAFLTMLVGLLYCDCKFFCFALFAFSAFRTPKGGGITWKIICFSSPPCQSLGEWVSEWLIVSDLEISIASPSFANLLYNCNWYRYELSMMLLSYFSRPDNFRLICVNIIFFISIVSLALSLP